MREKQPPGRKSIRRVRRANNTRMTRPQVRREGKLLSASSLRVILEVGTQQKMMILPHFGGEAKQRWCGNFFAEGHPLAF